MPPRYTPWDLGTHALRVGLAPLDPADWIEPDDAFAAQRANARALTETRFPEVYGALPQAEAAEAEVRAMLQAYLPARFPHLYARQGAAVAVRGEAPPEADLPLLVQAGLLVQEDLCLLQEEDGRFVLSAAHLCAPAGWRLADKLGRALPGVHDPVPGYAAELASRVDRIFAGLRPEQPLWRANWSIATEPTLFMPDGHGPHAEDIDAANAGARIFLRVERQTLRKLPRTGAVLFTIKTLIDPLSALEGSPRLAASLAAAARSMNPAMQRYKALPRLLPAMTAYLDGIAQSS